MKENPSLARDVDADPFACVAVRVNDDDGHDGGDDDGHDGGEVWRRWAPLLQAAEAWLPSGRRTVVVSPHPDDETLSTGGLIAHQARQGRAVLIVAVTDGDAAYDAGGDPHLAAQRRSEQSEAVRRLGLDARAIVRLGIADGRVSANEGAVQRHLHDLLRAGDRVIAPWTHDHHPDHEAAGRAALAAAEHQQCSIDFSLFWTWHHGSPTELPGRTRLRRLALSPNERQCKQHALASHLSQFAAADGQPILDDDLVEPARWRDEYYVVGPDCRPDSPRSDRP